MKLSIVSTLYRSATYVEAFCRQAAVAARQLVGEDYEIVLVNDGSPDSSLDVALRLCEADPHIVVVDLSRNFGHHKAMMTGLAQARGEKIFLIDSDLEEDPAWLLEFAGRMASERCDVVYGVQENRKGGLFERWSGLWFYRLFRSLTGITLPENLVTARLMSRRYVNALLGHEEREICIAGLWVITGFDQVSHVVTKKHTSETTYTIGKKLSVLVNSVTSFSNTPLMGIFYFGVLLSGISGLFTLSLLFRWLFLSKPLGGWTSLMASIWLLGGLIIAFIGVIGIYLSKIYSETKQRPYTIVRAIHRQAGPVPKSLAD